MMAEISRKYRSAPLIRELALDIVAPIPEKNWRSEVGAILSFCQTYVRYTKDVYGVETLQTPIQTLRLRQGDCDDKSMLCASLLMAIGHPVRFVAVGFDPSSFAHVFPQTKVGEKWVTLETTMEGWPVGRTCKGIKNQMVEHIRK